MTESEPKREVAEKRNIFYSVVLETLDLVERGRGAIDKWWKNNVIREMTERENDYYTLTGAIMDSKVSAESKQSTIDKYNKKYDTKHTLESIS